MTFVLYVAMFTLAAVTFPAALAAGREGDMVTAGILLAVAIIHAATALHLWGEL